MKRKLIAIGAAAAAAAAFAIATPAAHADPSLEMCAHVDVNGQAAGDCIVLPPDGGTPELPAPPALPGLPV